jgi:hypothetical protein
MTLPGTQVTKVTVGDNDDVLEETEREKCGQLCKLTRYTFSGTDLLVTLQASPPPPRPRQPLTPTKNVKS